MKHWKYDSTEDLYRRIRPAQVGHGDVILDFYDGAAAVTSSDAMASRGHAYAIFGLTPEEFDEASVLIRRRAETGSWAPKTLTADAIVEYFEGEGLEIDDVDISVEYWPASKELSIYGADGDRVCVVDLDDPETALKVLCALFDLDANEVRAEIEQ